MKIDLEVYPAKKFKINKAELQDFVNCVLDLVKPKSKQRFFLSLVILGDQKIKKLNKNYRNIDKVTDVLSFGYFSTKKIQKPQIDCCILGEILINYEQVKRQARLNKISFQQEFNFLFVHGLLHVFGFIHNTTNKAKQMDRMIKKVLAKTTRE